MDTAFYLLGNIVYTYIMYMFSNIFFDKEKTNGSLEFLLYLGYYIIHSTLHLTINNPIANTLSSLLPFFAITFIYKSSILKKVLATSASYVIAQLLEIFIFIAFDILKIESIYKQDFIYFVLLLSIVNLLSRFFSPQHKKAGTFTTDLPLVYYITIIFVPLGSIMVISFLKLNLSTFVVATFLLFINVDIYYLYDRLISYYAKKHENEIYKNQRSAYINELKNMERSQLQTRLLKHDMDNHILKMQHLLKNHEYEKLEEYLSETKSFIETDEKIIDCGNASIDGMLNYKLSHLKGMNVETDFNISVPSDIQISDFDLNIVLANLLDNSLEAIERLPDNDSKKLSIDISCKQGYFKMIIGNTFDGSVLQKGKTNKKDSTNHGIGLIGVERTVKKYDGSMKTEISEDWFEVSLLMYESAAVVN